MTDHGFGGECEFIAAVADLAQLPPFALPEIAFAGRSNVGKSSLINALTGRKALARTSHTPGRTQQLNFFEIAKRFMLVDMPGYGYAKVSKAERAAWDMLIRDYLRGRPNLRSVFVLIDGRHGVKDIDCEIFAMLGEVAVPARAILTKADKVKPAARDALIAATNETLKSFGSTWPNALLVSSHERENIQGLQDVINEIVL